MMLPYGYPFEQEFKGSISGEHFMYEYKKLPDDLETKYLEACTNLTCPRAASPVPRASLRSSSSFVPASDENAPSCPGLFRDGGGEAFPQPRRLRNPSL